MARISAVITVREGTRLTTIKVDEEFWLPSQYGGKLRALRRQIKAALR